MAVDVAVPVRGQWAEPIAVRESKADDRVFLLLLLPAGLLAGILYLAGAVNVAIGLAAVAFGLSVILVPQVGLFAYFAWQALDAATVTKEQAVLTPAKAFAPFLLAVYVLWLFRRRQPIRLSKQFIYVAIAYGAFGTLTSAFAIAPLASFRYSSQIIVQVLLIVMALHLLQTHRLVARSALFLWLGGVLLATGMFITGGVTSRFGRGTFGEYANPNTTAMALAIALMAIPMAWALTKHKIFYLIYLASVPYILLAMLNTGSRSAIFGVAVGLVFGPFMVRGTSVAKRVLVVVIGLLIVGYTFTAVLKSDTMTEKSRKRLETFVFSPEQTEGGARGAIWMGGLRVFKRYPLTGCGMGNTAFAMERHEGAFKDIHNSFLGSLVETGVIGFMLFSYAIWLLFRCVLATRYSRYGVPTAMMFAFLLASGATHTITYSKWFWVPVTFCLLLAELAERERIEAQSAVEPSIATA